MKKINYILFVVVLFFNMIVYGQWVQIPNGIGSNSSIGALTANGNIIFAGTWDSIAPGSVYISTNNGNNWNIRLTLSNSYDVNCLGSTGNNIITGADSNLWISTNSGSNWFATLRGQDILGLDVAGSSIFAGSYRSGNGQVFRSDNNGLNWTNCGLNQTGYCFTKLGVNVFAGTEQNGVYISSDNGSSWVQTSLNNKEVHAIVSLDGKVFAGTDTGIYVSSNNGSNWNVTSVNSGYVYSMIVSNNNIIACLPSIGILLSTNSGVTWITKNEGLPPGLATLKIIESNNYLYVGTYGNSVYRRPASQVFGIVPISSEIPVKFNLFQNYPNPFNPTTIIRFDVQKTSFINIMIYDMLGRELEILVNEQLKPGTFEVDWDGSNYTSGVYFYKLRTESYSETRKMILIK